MVSVSSEYTNVQDLEQIKEVDPFKNAIQSMYIGDYLSPLNNPEVNNSDTKEDIQEECKQIEINKVKEMAELQDHKDICLDL